MTDTRAAYLDTLNPAQREAVVWGTAPGHEAEGALLIIAGAGTGKTNTLAHRVAHLIAAGAEPERMLLLTFSRRAADEMTRRVRRILAAPGAGTAPTSPARFDLPWSGTFHAVGARLLREYAGRIGMDPGFTIHDREDAADLLALVRHDRGLAAQEKRFPQKGTCLAIYSAVVNTTQPLGEILQARYPWCASWEAELKGLFGAYVAAKQVQHVLDYDDLLLYWAHMLEDATLARELGERFSHVLVDEYQDTNRLQARILLALKPTGAGLTVVGDDAQSIYAFRGATVRNILDFPQSFEPPAKVLALEQNYRSSAPILSAANAVMALAPERYTKALWTQQAGGHPPRLLSVEDDAAQARCIVETVLARREEGLRLKQQAVLFRAAQHSARLEVELTRSHIPFVKYGGLKFLEAAHVKDVLSLLRFAQNRRDRIAGFRALQLLPGIGPKIAARVLDTLAAAPPGCELLAEQPVPAAARESWAVFAQLVETTGNPLARWPATFEALCAWYAEQLGTLFEDGEWRRGDIEQLQRIAATYPDRERFLTALTLDPPEASSGEAGVPLRDEDYLILSTIHSAKGQEWRAVSVLNVVDGCLPSDMATGTPEEIEEERRLLYVAMTRAKAHLDLYIPQRFYVTQQASLGGRHVYASRTRFIPAGVLDHFEAVTWPPPQSESPANPQARAQAVDLAAKMRGMWG